MADGQENDFAFDQDGDGLASVVDEDSDDDQLFDGTERGLTGEALAFPDATDAKAGVFRADKDPATTTFALVADTDRGGMLDGVEDYSHDGRVDVGETDPLVQGDDGTINGDLDDDTLPNALEIKLGTNPNSADTDGDGLSDPTELGDLSHPLDTDADGQIDAVDTDSDGDTVPDKDEAGLLPDAPIVPQVPVDSDGDTMPDYRDTDSDDDTLADGDEVHKWHTDWRLADTDGGGLSDDVEVLQTETNPLDPSDDLEVLEPGAKIRGTTPLSCGTSGRDPGVLGLLAIAVGLLLGRRRKFSMLKVFLVLPMLVLPALGFALTPPDVTGMRMNLDGQGMLGVEAARQIELGTPTFAVQTQYAYRPLVVGTDLAVVRPLVDGRLQADLGAAWRVWRNLTLGAYLPLALYQTGSRPSLYGPMSGPIRNTAVGDLMLAAKWVLMPDRAGGWGVAAMLPLTLPTGSPEDYTGRPGATVMPTAMTSAQFGPWRVAMNAGVRIQAEQQAFNVTDGPALRLGAAGSLNPSVVRGNWKHWWRPEGWWLDASLTYETPLTSPLQHGPNERLEAGLALNLELGSDFYLSAGSTFGLWPGFGVPAFRPMVSIRYVEQPRVAVAP